MAKQDVITKLYRLEDKEYGRWTEKKIGAEAANVYVRTGQGGAIPAQSLLLNSTPPAVYQYGQDLWDANNQVFEALTWDNIQKWLNEGRINDFLKEGDCIEVTTDIITYGTQHLKWHFYIIGINRHNGQSKEDLSNNLSHIDFCGGSMARLSKDFRTANDLPPAEFNFANMASNNGGLLENETHYGNYFVDSDLFTASVESSVDQVLAKICKQDEMHFADKVLYLDARFQPEMEVLREIFGSIERVNNFLVSLANFWEDNYQNKENLGDMKKVYENAARYWYSEEFQPFQSDFISASAALQFLRYGIEDLTDNFLDDVTYDGNIQIDANFANNILRASVSLISIPNPNQSDFMEQIEVLISNHSGNSNIDGAGALLFILTRMARCAYEKLLNTTDSSLLYYSSHSSKANRHAKRKIWGLTEKEIFGECTFSKAEYAQGQIFQYPIFNNIAYRQKITDDLLKVREGVELIPHMITLTPVENSNVEVVGMDINTLMPESSSVLKDGDYLPDTPICFRIQQDS